MRGRPFTAMVASLAAVALLPWAARAALGPRYGGELAVGLTELSGSLDPDVPRGISEGLLAGLVHETLVNSGSDGVPVPRLARSWASAAGGREWTLHLVESALFHDGKPVTSTEVARSLRRFLRSASPAAQRFAETLEGGLAYRARSSEAVPGIIPLDPTHLTIRLTEAVPCPLAPLSASAAAITSASGAGAGPFAPLTWLPSKSRLLTAFAAHLAGRPYLDQVQLLLFPDQDSSKTALQAGRISLTPTLGHPSHPPTANLVLILDQRQPPFDQRETRSAVASALSVPGLLKPLLQGGEASASLLLPSLLPPLGLPATPARAPLTGRATMVVSREVPHLLSQRVVAHLLEAGLAVTAEPTSARGAVAAQAPLRLVLLSPEVAEPGLALRELAALGQPIPSVQDSLSAAESEFGLDRRWRHLHRAEAALRNEFTLVPLLTVPLSYASRPGVRGVATDPRGRLLLEDAWLEP